jgi:hypothetical protein
MEDCIYLVLALGWTKEVPKSGNPTEEVLAARRGASLAVEGLRPWFHGQWRWCPWGGRERVSEREVVSVGKKMGWLCW